MDKNKHANELTLYRKRRMLSQKKVAALLGHSDTSMLSRYESGRSLPPLPGRRQLAVSSGKTDLCVRPSFFTSLHPWPFLQAVMRYDLASRSSRIARSTTSSTSVGCNGHRRASNAPNRITARYSSHSPARRVTTTREAFPPALMAERSSRQQPSLKCSSQKRSGTC